MPELNDQETKALGQREKSLLAIHSGNLEHTQRGIQFLQESGQYVPVHLMNTLRTEQSAINAIYRKAGLPQKYIITPVEIDMAGKSFRPDLDESSRTQMQNALEIHLLNLAHATAEKQRLEQIGTLPPIVDAQIESARAEIRKLEEKLFQ